uniref:Transmembrane protein 128 n=1 Tax=Cavia porcellus TaxID=10141 RepID=A0A286XM39_CAVPO
VADYDVQYPTLVPITTATFIAAGICFSLNLRLFVTVIFNVALWNVWSFFTPLLLFTQFMGVVMFISLLG